jgi:hypothetical protein
MQKVSVLVEIPDGFELACAEERFPVPGEWAVRFDETNGDANYAELVPVDLQEEDIKYVYGKSIIVRPVWQWPEWLTCRWVWKGPSGYWRGSDSKPQVNGGIIGSDYYWAVNGVVLPLELTAFDPPPCDDWTKSLRQNPVYEGS